MGLDLTICKYTKEQYDIVMQDSFNNLFYGEMSDKTMEQLEQKQGDPETYTYDNEIYTARVGSYGCMHRLNRIPMINKVHGTSFTYAELEEAYDYEEEEFDKRENKLVALALIVRHADHAGLYLHDHCKLIVEALGDEMKEISDEYAKVMEAQYPDLTEGEGTLEFFKAIRICADTENSIIEFH